MGGEFMSDMMAVKIRFHSEGILHVSVVISESLPEAFDILKNEYKEYGINIHIEEYEVIDDEKGIVLTWIEPIKD
jgi:hypothetical protein